MFTLYGRLCLSFGEGSCTTDRSIMIIITTIIIIICVRRDQGRHASGGRDVQQSFLPSFVGELECCLLSEINVTAVR